MPEDKDFELDDLDSFSFEDLDFEGDSPVLDSSASPSTEYGVWVKTTSDDEQGAILSEEASAQVPETEAFLSSQEPDLYNQGRADSLEEEPLLGTLADNLEDDHFAEISLDDFVDFEDDSAQALPPATETPETPVLESEPEEDFLDIDIEIEDEIDDHELEILEGAQVKNETSSPVESVAGTQEIDLSEFGDFFDEEPELDSAKSPQKPISVEEAPNEELPEDLSELVADFAQDDFSLDEKSDMQGSLSVPQTSAIENGEPLPDLEAFDTDAFFEIPAVPALTELPDNGEFEEILLADAKDEMNMDHIIALENDLTSGIRPTPELPLPVSSAVAIQPPSPLAEGDLASRVLLKIESELSSIKQELSDLKKEITSIRTPNPVEQVNEEPQQARHGFFDEEDDETIALTGDELENIFSTAQINETEESGEKLEDLDDLIQLSPEGVPTASEPEPLPTNDQDFFSGTPLASDDQLLALSPQTTDIPVPNQANLSNVPESIELEEELDLDDLPEALEVEATENLMGLPAEGAQFEGAGIEHIASDTFELESPILEIPFDEDIILEEESFIEEELSLDAVDPHQELESVVPLEELTTSNETPPFSTPMDTVETPLVENRDTVVPTSEPSPTETSTGPASQSIKEELKAVLSYMDRLLASLPDEKIQEFAESEHFGVYKRLFEELGLVE